VLRRQRIEESETKLDAGHNRVRSDTIRWSSLSPPIDRIDGAFGSMEFNAAAAGDEDHRPCEVNMLS
jgi:hypothetical protein